MSVVRRAAVLLTSLIALACVALPAAASAAPEELNTRLTELSNPDLRDAGPAQQARAVSVAADGPGSLMRDGGKLVVSVLVSGSARERAAGIEDAGGQVTAIDAADQHLDVSVDESNLRAIAAAPGVISVTEQLVPMVAGVDDSGDGGASGGNAINTCATGVVSEGDTQLGAATARNQFQVDGTGVKVGVLSDSFDISTDPTIHAVNDVASGDLPGPGNPCGRSTPVQVLDDSNLPANSEDEGRAMTQIVHDMAPGAGLAFATASNGEALFANNIRALASAGSKVIVDDVTYFDEPMYQDGLVANAVNDVTNQGVAYFSSAANNNRYLGGNPSNSWEAPAYRPTTCPAIPTVPAAGDCMDFNPGAGVDNTFNLTSNGQPVTGSRTWRFILGWGEPQQGVTDNFDLYVINQATNTVVKSDEVNTTTQRAFEFVGFNPANTTANNYQLVIRRTSGTGTPRIKWINADNNQGNIAGLEYPTSSGGDVIGPTIFGHNGAANAQSVAAIPFNQNTTPETFTSQGPVTHLFGPINGSTPAASLGSPQVLAKPDITATDKGINSFFPAPCTTCRFSGTSAAAPHAAGVAALQLDINPGLPQAQLKAAQVSSAVPIGSFGHAIVGAGLLQAPAAVNASRDLIVPTVSIGKAPKKKLKSKKKKVKATVTFTSDDAGATFQCAVDKSDFKACASPFTAKVKAKPRKGAKHTISVTATDVADNVSPPAKAQFKAVLKKKKRK